MKASVSSIKPAALMVTAALVLSGCFGGDGGSSGTTVSGVASKGPLSGADICAYKIENQVQGSQIVCGKTADGSGGKAVGSYTLDLGNYSGDIILEVKKGTYSDEASGALTPLDGSLRVAIADARDSVTAAVTPITEAMVQNAVDAGGLSAARINQAFIAAKAALGGLDPVTTLPVDATDAQKVAAASNAQKGYAALLGGVSQKLKDAGTGATMAQTITAMKANLTAGKDFKALEASAIDGFLANAGRNKTGIASTAALQTLISGLASNSGSSGGTSSSGSGSGNVCIADASYQGASIATVCYTDLPAGFSCSQVGIQGAGGTVQQSVGTYAFSTAAACPANPTATFSLKGLAGSSSGGSTASGGTTAPAGVSLSPSTGAAGTQVTVSGLSMQTYAAYQPNQIKFGTEPGTGYSVAFPGSTASVSARVPSGLAAGSYTVTYASAGGSQPPITVGTFTVTAAGGGSTGSSTAGSAIGTGLYTAVTAQDNSSFLSLLSSACTTKTVVNGGTDYGNCTQPSNASYAANLTANMWMGGLPHQTGGSIVGGPSSYTPGTAKVSLNNGMAGVAANDSCSVGIAEPYIPIVTVEAKGARYYASGINFSFKGTANDTISVTSGGVVSQYTMTNGQGGKIEVHPNLALFNSGTGSEAVVGSVDSSGMWTNYFTCR